VNPETLAVPQAIHDEQDARRRELDKREADASLTAHDRRMIAAAKVRRREELREELRRRNAQPPGPTRAEKAKAEKAAKRARAKVRKAAHAAGKGRPKRTTSRDAAEAALDAFTQPQPAPLQVYDEAAPLNKAVAAVARKLDGLAAGLNAFADGEAPPPENAPLDQAVAAVARARRRRIAAGVAGLLALAGSVERKPS
jgi:hypothetical protein